MTLADLIREWEAKRDANHASWADANLPGIYDAEKRVATMMFDHGLRAVRIGDKAYVRVGRLTLNSYEAPDAATIEIPNED